MTNALTIVFLGFEMDQGTGLEGQDTEEAVNGDLPQTPISVWAWRFFAVGSG